MTSNTTETAEALEKLATDLRGEVIDPNHPEYDQARSVYNGMIDRRPAAVVRCRDAADVRACVHLARDHRLDLAVRGGAHSGPGFGTWDGALVVDLAPMRSVALAPDGGTVRVDGGCTWADVDHATVPFGLVVPAGFFSNTGVGGLTLGGGVTGYLGRSYGLTVDNLVSADVVLADGSFVTASDTSHPDLFWALRGGGGNYGVVTSFTFACRPVGENGVVIGGPVLYDITDAAEVLRWYRETQPSLPEDLGGWIGLLTIPPAPPFPENLWGRKACGIVWCYYGPHERADEVLKPVRSFSSPLLDGIHALPYSMLASAFNALYPAGLQWYWRADFFEELSDEAIEVHRAFGEKLPTGHSTMHLYPIDGAVARVSADATPFAYRNGGWAAVIAGVDPDPANNAAITSWTKEYWEALHPFSAGGAYINFMGQEGQDRVRASYRHNYARLAEVKRRYDPQNLFHVNQNIPPAGQS